MMNMSKVVEFAMEDVEQMLSQFNSNKIGNITLDSDTEFKIKNEFEKTLDSIRDELLELDEVIDMHIKDMNARNEEMKQYQYQYHGRYI